MTAIAADIDGIESLPSVVPIFPLPGVLLLPRGRLPRLNRRPRYTWSHSMKRVNQQIRREPVEPLRRRQFPPWHSTWLGPMTSRDIDDAGDHLGWCSDRGHPPDLI